MALQVGGVNFPGVGTGSMDAAATPTKILCLTEVCLGRLLSINKLIVIAMSLALTFFAFGVVKVITTDELMDDGEYDDILEDMRDEGGKFGMNISILVFFFF